MIFFYFWSTRVYKKNSIIMLMNNIIFKRKKEFALFIVLIFCFSLIANSRNNLATQTNSLTDTYTTPTEPLGADKIPLPRKLVSHYVDESIVAYIDDSPENVTSPGTFDNSLIIGEADGLKMSFDHIAPSIEYALLKLNGSITSDSLTLMGVDDWGDIDSILEVYGWSDPYAAPTADSVNETYVDGKFTFLGFNDVFNGDIVLSYDNISLEYILLYDVSAVAAPTYIDAVEVHGFVSFIADEGKNGIPHLLLRKHRDLKLKVTAYAPEDVIQSGSCDGQPVIFESHSGL